VALRLRHHRLVSKYTVTSRRFAQQYFTLQLDREWTAQVSVLPPSL
jgi:hypothetical protein